MYHVKTCHTDLYIKFERTTAGILESIDVLSMPEDKLSSLLGNRFPGDTLKIIQGLREESKLQNN